MSLSSENTHQTPPKTKHISANMRITSIISKLSASAAIALTMSVSPAQGAVSLISNYVGGTAPTINSSYGTLEFALNMGGAGLTRDGITFTAAGTTPSGATRNFLTSGGVGATINVVGVTQGGTRNWATTTLSGSTDSLFHTIAFANHSTSPGYEITVSGLDATKSYQVQFLHGDPRTAYPYTSNASVTDSSLNVATAPMTYGSASANDEFAMLTMVVSGSTSFKYRSFNTGTGGPGISGLVVHSVPEPTAALLGGLGLLSLLRRRR